MQSDLYQMCSFLLYQHRKESIRERGKVPKMETKGAIGAVAVCESLAKGERELRATRGPQNLHVPETLNRVIYPNKLSFEGPG
jgi:hypothetical protein